MKNRYRQTDLITIGKIFLLCIIVFTVGKKDAVSIDEWLLIKKNSVISCSPVKSDNGLNSWPGDDNSGNGCAHQPVVAALLSRVKRDKMHGCENR